jgi:hypothetical protein
MRFRLAQPLAWAALLGLSIVSSSGCELVSGVKDYKVFSCALASADPCEQCFLDKCCTQMQSCHGNARCLECLNTDIAKCTDNEQAKALVGCTVQNCVNVPECGPSVLPVQASDCKLLAANDCITCCGSVSPKGKVVFNDQANTCVCQKDQCKSFCDLELCQGTPELKSSQCAGCLGNEFMRTVTPCAPQREACNGDTDCTAYADCLKGCFQPP